MLLLSKLGHGMHGEVGSLEYVPAGHASQLSMLIAPGAGWVVPAGQRLHADRALAPCSGLKVPAGQAVQTNADAAPASWQ